MRKEKCCECADVFEIADNERILCCNCEKYQKDGDPCSFDMDSKKVKCKNCGRLAHVCILH